MAEFTQSIALVIGINAYDHGIPALETARFDAERLASILRAEHGYETILLIDEQASLAAIRQLLNVDLAQRLTNQDRMLFYFAGHGIALDSDSGPNGYLLPQDARRGEEDSYLHMPGLHDALCALNCRHMLVILDSCFGGAFRWSATRDIVSPPAVIHQERYDRFTTDPAWQVITSASHDQVALDELTSGSLGSRGPMSDGQAHSPFALALFEGLQGAADVIPSDSKDGVITASELYIFLEDRLQREALAQNQQQTPRLWPLAKHDKGEFIFLVPGHELNLPPAPPLNFDNNPYLGLHAFDAVHRHLFFGRSDAIKELHAYVMEHPLTVVLGASGTGKSSLVKAGLIPTLPEDWVQLEPIRPGNKPLHYLQQALEKKLKLELPAGATEQAILDGVETWCAENPGKILLVPLDQFEELITMCHEASLRDSSQRLIAQLLELLPQQVRVIITLRLDFEPQFNQGPLKNWWQDAKYIIQPMSQNELREVIELPAAEMVMYFKPAGLVDALINEVISNPGGLPLLSFALSEMYLHYVKRQSSDRAIEAEDYDAVGGVVGSLSSSADQVYDNLPPDCQSTMQQIILRMVSAESGNELARRRVTRAELDYASDAEDKRVTEVISRLSEARLIVEGMEDNNESYIEPAHDALVRAWDKLINWVNKVKRREIDNLRFRRSLSAAARNWQQSDNKTLAKALLWRDPVRAAQLTSVLEQDSSWMNDRELRFAKASVRSGLVARRILLATLALIAALAVGAGFAAFFATENARRADTKAAEASQERDRAQSSILAIRSNTAWNKDESILGSLYAVEAYRRSPTLEARSALMSSLQRMPGLQLNKGDKRILAGSNNTLVANYIWPLDADKFMLSSSCTRTTDFCYDKPHQVELWDSAGEPMQAFQPFTIPGSPSSLVFNKTTRMALLSGDGFTALLSPDRAIWKSKLLPLTAAQFVADTYWVAGIGADGSMQFVDTLDRAPTQRLKLPFRADAFAVAPGKNLIAVAGKYAGKTQIGRWELPSGRRLSLSPQPGGIESLDYTRDGRFLITSGSRPVIAVPSEEQPNPPASQDQSYVAWWPASEQDIALGGGVSGFLPGMSAPIVSDDSQYLAVGSRENESGGLIWKLDSAEQVGEDFDWRGQRPMMSAKFSADGSLLAILRNGLKDNEVIVLDTRRGEIRLQSLYPGLLRTLEFSDDNSKLWLSHGNSYTRWEMKSGNWAGQTLPNVSSSNAVAYSPAGNTLATAGSELQFWNRAGKELAPAQALDSAASGLLYNSDGNQLALVTAGQLNLWDTSAQPAKLRWSLPGSFKLNHFSVDGLRLTVVDSQELIDISVANGERLGRSTECGGLPRATDLGLAFSLHDGDDHGWVNFIDTKACRETGESWGLGSGAKTASYHAGSQKLAIGTNAGSVEIWDFAQARPLDPPLPVFGLWDMQQVVFNPADGILAVYGNGVELWDLDARQRMGETIKPGGQVVFSPDGEQLAITNDKTTLWNLSADRWMQRACAMVNRNLRRQEWESVLGTTPYRCTCENLPPHPDFALEACP